MPFRYPISSGVPPDAAPGAINTVMIAAVPAKSKLNTMKVIQPSIMLTLKTTSVIYHFQRVSCSVVISTMKAKKPTITPKIKNAIH